MTALRADQEIQERNGVADANGPLGWVDLSGYLPQSFWMLE